MSVTHHPNDATLMEFAAGSLSEPLAIVVASHLELCSVCRSAMPIFSEIGGAFMVREVQAPPEEEAAYERLLARLDNDSTVTPAFEGRAREASASAGDLPSSLARLVRGGLDSIEWRKVIPGADDWQLHFQTSDGDHSLRFLRAQPGRELPEHSHAGTELTLVLRGALRDGNKILMRGDVTDLDNEGTHNPVVHGDEPCFCVIANEGPPRFKALKMRILQKLIGI